MQREASDGAKIVEGPVQAEAAVTAIEGMDQLQVVKQEREGSLVRPVVQSFPLDQMHF